MKVSLSTYLARIALGAVVFFALIAVPIAGFFIASAGVTSQDCTSGPMSATLTGTATGGNAPRGTARYRERGGNRMSVDVRSMNLPANTTLSVFVGDTNVGTITPRNGNGQLRVDAPTVAIAEGTTVAVRNGTTDVLSGTFACVARGGNTNVKANGNANMDPNMNMNMDSNMNMNMNSNSNANSNMNSNSNSNTNRNSNMNSNMNSNSNMSTNANSTSNTNSTSPIPNSNTNANAVPTPRD